MRFPKVWLLLLAPLAAAQACDDGTITLPEDPGVAEDSLTFVQFDPSVLPRITREASFWAVRGESREIRMRYAPENPGEEGEEFLEFEVDDESLLRRPDGTLFAEGDSILITVRVDTTDRFVFTMEPSGLVFDPDEPAELEVDFLRSERDLNGDGVVNDADEALRRTLRIWKQERPGDPWFPLGTVEVREDRLRADIDSFTGFALAT